MSRPDEPVTAGAVRRAAMDLLARREHSLRELQLKLQKRFPESAELIAQSLQDLREEGLQSDERYVASLVRSHVARGRGPQRIRAELRQKGLEEGLIETALREAEVDWLQLLRDVSRSKFGTKPATDWQERAKRARFFQYRGFDFDTIKQLEN